MTDNILFLISNMMKDEGGAGGRKTWQSFPGPRSETRQEQKARKTKGLLAPKDGASLGHPGPSR